MAKSIKVVLKEEPELQTVTITSEESDDWIKTGASYKNEMEVHRIAYQIYWEKMRKRRGDGDHQV